MIRTWNCGIGIHNKERNNNAVPKFYSVSDNGFGKARERNPSKSYILVRRRGFRLITQSKIFIWKAILEFFAFDIR